MAAASRRLTLSIPPEVAETIRHLSPDLERGVKAALRALSMDPSQGTPLTRELEGKWRYRVRRYRIVYEVALKARACRIVAVGHRHQVYEQLAAQVRPGPSAAPS